VSVIIIIIIIIIRKMVWSTALKATSGTRAESRLALV
jgi:hypothetical protein